MTRRGFCGWMAALATAVGIPAFAASPKAEKLIARKQLPPYIRGLRISPDGSCLEVQRGDDPAWEPCVELQRVIPTDVPKLDDLHALQRATDDLTRALREEHVVLSA